MTCARAAKPGKICPSPFPDQQSGPSITHHCPFFQQSRPFAQQVRAVWRNRLIEALGHQGPWAALPARTEVVTLVWCGVRHSRAPQPTRLRNPSFRAKLAPMLRVLTLLALATPAQACETALLLAIDVSGSIDRGEYALQTGGLHDALRDPDVAAVLLQGQVALSVVQWSGVGRQALVIPWQRMLSPQALDQFAEQARTLPRAFDGSDTAVGDAVTFALAQFSAVSDCKRLVIDISGDGPENAGTNVARARTDAVAQGVEINAIAIEDMGQSAPTSSFYKNWVVTPKGFVMTARGLEDYPRTLRAKLLRELIKPTG